MKKSLGVLIVTMVCVTAMLSAQAPGAISERFGLGTFRYQGKTFTGLVLRDAYVVDLAAAAVASKQQVPGSVLAIIEQYDNGVGDRIKVVVRDVAGRLATNRPAYIYDLKAVDALQPFEPRTALYARSNYIDHAAEMDARNANPTAPEPKVPPSLPGIWERGANDTRQNPYLFVVPPTIFSGDGDAIQVPLKRSQIDYECELVGVMGKLARRVPVDRLKDYIFGYTQSNDVSDRQNRAPETGGGGDWWIQKGQDTFKPWGPYIVPKEFLDPLNMQMKFTLSGKVLQDDNTKNATHNMYELAHYASNLLTLRPGDILTIGTPPGVGTARKPPVYMKAGDVSVCAYEGLGTLTNPVIAESANTTSSR
jgi:2-keto-4-pentenoate hydratase/2-oxohepta-3-ene-1,7-dioic acid hydratase in catechol pathway